MVIIKEFGKDIYSFRFRFIGKKKDEETNQIYLKYYLLFKNDWCNFELEEFNIKLPKLKRFREDLLGLISNSLKEKVEVKLGNLVLELIPNQKNPYMYLKIFFNDDLSDFYAVHFNLDHVERLYEYINTSIENIEMLEEDKCCYVGVRIDNTLFHYLSTFVDVKVGKYVLVEGMEKSRSSESILVGKGQEKIGKIETIDIYNKNNVPYPINEMKHILRVFSKYDIPDKCPRCGNDITEVDYVNVNNKITLPIDNDIHIHYLIMPKWNCRNCNLDIPSYISSYEIIRSK